MLKAKAIKRFWLTNIGRLSIKRIAIMRFMLVGCVPVSVNADDVWMAEQKLLSGLQAIQTLSIKDALGQFSDLGDQYPKYKLAQLVKADLLALKAGQKSLLDNIHSKYAGTVSKLKDEAAVRWQFSQSELQTSPSFDKYVLKSAQQPHIVLVSLSESRLYLYERNSEGVMTRVADYYVTMGREGSGKQKEGDLRTPIGVYHIVDLLPGSGLPDLYGVGALPLNYPNQWDTTHGKTGSGIWLHGTPSDTYTRAPKASKGCVVLNNSAMQKLLADYQLPFATPVLIVNDTEQIMTDTVDQNLALAEVKAWLNNHYIAVNWSSVSVYRYPDEQNLFYVTFPAAIKNELVHQYWQRNNQGAWQLVMQSQEPVQVKSRT